MRRKLKCLIFKRDNKNQLQLCRERGACNKKAQQKDNQQNTRKTKPTINKISKNQCPLDINCLQNNIIYQSMVQSAGNEEKYM